MQKSTLQENDLDDVILLNPDKKKREPSLETSCCWKKIRLKSLKQSEGAYISPLMENFVTFLHKNAFVIIEEAELKCFRNTKSRRNSGNF